MVAATPAVLGFDPADPAFVADPYPVYRELRERHPVLYNPTTNQWLVSRFADVNALLRDRRLGRTYLHLATHAEMGRPDDIEWHRPWWRLVRDGMLDREPPDHTRLRRLANKAFTPRAVERLRPRVTEIVDGLLDAATADGRTFDVMADLAEPLPVVVICELLGVPVEDQAQFKPWSETVSRMIDPDVTPEMVGDALPAVLGFVQYFNELIEQRRADPRDDLLSSLIAAEAEGDVLGHQELLVMIILLFIAGHETTTNLIGNGTLALLRHPTELERLRADPALAVDATEELLRYDPAAQMTVRTATEDLELRGIPLAKGESVVCALAAANRDPRVFDDPDVLRLDRHAHGHLAFSGGMHYCLGAPLARLEGQVTFAALAARFPELALATDQVTYRDHFILRGLTALPVTV